MNTTKKRKSFYGFLNLKTGKEHTFITDWHNMYITVEVLEKLRKLYPTQKLVLIWDNCGWHRGSKVTEWIEQDGNTETIHFPPYTLHPTAQPSGACLESGTKSRHPQPIHPEDRRNDRTFQSIH
jgi:DDE superfamily endonuclease